MSKKDLINDLSDLWTDEAIATQVEEDLRKYQAKTGKPIEFPIYPDEIAKSLWEISTEYPDHVYDESGNDVLARFDATKRVIEVSSSKRANDGQVSFTTAHEVGHISMHGFMSSVYCGSPVNERSSRQIEKQADKYASLLLMPSDITRKAIEVLVSRGSLIDIEILAPELMTLFKVSRQALEIRLGQLGYQLLNSKYGVSYERTHQRVFLELEEERQSSGRLV
ncbi:MAG: ImmA/IrrE family metallo-endopeptidase [Candidatus Yanofskybacteria bacterium]|nr:ImmA/IrrE family metallo-endopeptidase [Candidatus Yanofskybacteria bacterium]